MALRFREFPESRQANRGTSASHSNLIQSTIMSDPTPDPLSENPTLPEPIVPPTLPEPIVPLRGTSYSEIFEGLLKAPKSLIAAFSENKEGTPFLKKLIVLAALGFLVFGVTIGSFSYHEQLWAAPLKTLIGIIFSSLICLPSLYIFAALTGTPLKLKDIVQGMAGALADRCLIARLHPSPLGLLAIN